MARSPMLSVGPPGPLVMVPTVEMRAPVSGLMRTRVLTPPLIVEPRKTPEDESYTRPVRPPGVTGSPTTVEAAVVWLIDRSWPAAAPAPLPTPPYNPGSGEPAGSTSTEIVCPGSTLRVKLSTSPGILIVPAMLGSYTSDPSGGLAVSDG